MSLTNNKEPRRPWALQPFRTRSAAQMLIDTIDCTGGLVQADDADPGTKAPAGEPGWSDLGDAYLQACKELGVEPLIELDELPDAEDEEAEPLTMVWPDDSAPEEEAPYDGRRKKPVCVHCGCRLHVDGLDENNERGCRVGGVHSV